VFRILQLLEFAEQNLKLPLKQICDNWWGQWQIFAEQFYALVEDGYVLKIFINITNYKSNKLIYVVVDNFFRLIDFQQFVLSLSRARTSGGSKIKDNSVLWLLTQCISIL
jgi:hypothetical protein